MPLWVSDAEPGSVHDPSDARAHVLPVLHPACARGLDVLADSDSEGAGIGIRIPVHRPADGNVLDVDTRTRNRLLRALRRLGERGFTLLTRRRRILQRITAGPSRTGDIARAALVLTRFEHGRLV